jgi:CheY-like chemotaxis protein
MKEAGDKRLQCVMTVDDERNVLDLVKTCLEMEGLSVLAYDNALDALAAYQEHWREIDLVILDYLMPEMNGAILFDRLRELNPSIRAILLSGSGDDFIEDLLSQGIRGYIRKPFYLNDLIQQVRDNIVATEPSKGGTP